MPGREDDIGFGFDPKPFLNGLAQVNKGLGNFEKGMARAFKGAILHAAAIGLAIKGSLSTVKEFMPEIGKSMGIAKEIFFKNFLWPLRQAVAPYLQLLLNWVRDNRAMFVKWGQTLANVFKVVVMVVKALWTTLKAVIQLFEPFIRKIFHGGFQDFVDLILTKVAVILAWVASGLGKLVKEVSGPLSWVMRTIGDIAENVWRFVKGLFAANKQGKSLSTFFRELGQGLVLAFKVVLRIVDKLISGITHSQLKNVMTPLTGIAGAFKGLMQTLNDLVSSKGGGDFFEWIGHQFGNSVQQALLAVAMAVEVVVDALQWLIQAIKSVTELSAGKSLMDIGEQMKALAAQQGSRWKPLLAAQADLFKDDWNQIKKVFPTIDDKNKPNPIAAPSLLGVDQGARTATGTGSRPIKVDVGVNVNVNATQAQVVAKVAADKVEDAIYKRLVDAHHMSGN